MLECMNFLFFFPFVAFVDGWLYAYTSIFGASHKDWWNPSWFIKRKKKVIFILVNKSATLTCHLEQNPVVTTSCKVHVCAVRQQLSTY
ncbi:hypothetical protein V8C37DRAFT_207838 [Trichoderma ceciliae]